MIFVPHTKTDYEIANSYLNTADADDIIGKQNNSEAWQGFDEPTKQMVLMQASLAVDGAFMYSGAKTSTNQLLKYPRNGAKALPTNIKFATALTALKYSNDDVFKNIKSEMIGKHLTVYFENKEIGEDVIAFLKPLKATTVKIKAGNSRE